jgi:hypothetical protein
MARFNLLLSSSIRRRLCSGCCRLGGRCDRQVPLQSGHQLLLEMRSRSARRLLNATDRKARTRLRVIARETSIPWRGLLGDCRAAGAAALQAVPGDDCRWRELASWSFFASLQEDSARRAHFLPRSRNFPKSDRRRRQSPYSRDGIVRKGCLHRVNLLTCKAVLCSGGRNLCPCLG